MKNNMYAAKSTDSFEDAVKRISMANDISENRAKAAQTRPETSVSRGRIYARRIGALALTTVALVYAGPPVVSIAENVAHDAVNFVAGQIKQEEYQQDHQPSVQQTANEAEKQIQANKFADAIARHGQ